MSVALIVAVGGVLAGSLILAGLFSAGIFQTHDSNAHASGMPLDVTQVFKARQKSADALGGSTYFQMDESFVDDENHCEFCIALEYKPGPKGKALVAFTNVKPIDLSAATKLTFAARGEQGGETLKIYAAGKKAQVSAALSDKAAAAEKDGIKGVKFAAVKKVTLTKTWQWYEIDLRNPDLSKVTHGFAFEVLKGKGNERQVAYLDSMQYK